MASQVRSIAAWSQVLKRKLPIDRKIKKSQGSKRHLYFDNKIDK